MSRRLMLRNGATNAADFVGSDYSWENKFAGADGTNWDSNYGISTSDFIPVTPGRTIEHCGSLPGANDVATAAWIWQFTKAMQSSFISRNSLATRTTNTPVTLDSSCRYIKLGLNHPQSTGVTMSPSEGVNFEARYV